MSSETPLPCDAPVDRRDHSLDAWEATLIDARSALEVFLGAYGYRYPLDHDPSPNPISLDPEHIEDIRRDRYVCAAKLDGTRYHVVLWRNGIGQHTASLVDRRLRCFTCSFVRAPKRAFRGTVLDAELVGGVLFVFDAIMVSGAHVGDLGYLARRRAALDARVARRDGADGADSMSLGFGDHRVDVVLKPIFEPRHAFRLLRSLRHSSLPCDGLVFTPAEDPIRSHTHWAMFKMKDVHTIDFRLVVRPPQWRRVLDERQTKIIERDLQEEMHVVNDPLAKTEAEVLAASRAPTKRKGRPLTSMQMQTHDVGKVLEAMRARRDLCSSDAPDTAPRADAPARRRWFAQLTYSVAGKEEFDAATSFDFNGRKIRFKLVEDAKLVELLGVCDRAWSEIERTVRDASLVSLSAIIECRVRLPNRDDVAMVHAERVRPDKTSPNSKGTIVRTLMSISKAARAEHVRQLGDGGGDPPPAIVE